MTLLINSLTILTIIFFPLCLHPLMMVLAIMILTLSSALALGVIQPSFWFSYILFLVFLGGLLVLFLYISSLAANEMVYLKMFYSSLMLLPLYWLMMIVFWFMNPTSTNYSHTSTLMMNYEDTASLTFSGMNFSLIILLMIYLLLTLVGVVNIVQLGHGPLRQWKYD
uniref:NADH-ubiquinone oxidoreductase chain 6 n=1 Tax=Halicryptus spinulosus TaxID=160677 RepID=L0N819_9BILA|nr:NADH dehydrogenase subunit 6 [Halicryptus spinulosus]CBK55562.1 NADH dehydrogenase subunit 6 [Halicryptus spinulosus]